MCYFFLGAWTFFSKTKLYAFIVRRIDRKLMKESDEETDDKLCSSLEIRKDVKEISIRVESSVEGTYEGDKKIKILLLNGKNLIDKIFLRYLSFKVVSGPPLLLPCPLACVQPLLPSQKLRGGAAVHRLMSLGRLPEIGDRMPRKPGVICKYQKQNNKFYL